MDQDEKLEARKKVLNTSILDIDQLCNLIDENTFGLQSFSSSKYHSIPFYQIKTFHSSRLKRLHSSSIIKSNLNENDNSSSSSSLVNKFRSLSTSNPRRCSSSSTNTKSILPSYNEEYMNSTTQSQLSCTLDDRQQTTTNSCNVEELAAYLDNFLYVPKSLSGAAELMYT